MPDIFESVTTTLVNTINNIVLFIPQLVSGFIILVVGWFVALALRYIVKGLFDLLKIDDFLVRMNLKQSSSRIWSEIASQVVFWFVFLTFLIPAFNAWQLTTVTGLLNQILLYIPNVFAAVVIGFIGYVIANIAYNLVRNAGRGAGQASNLFGQVAKYSLYIFTALVVLNQLQIASNLIQLVVSGLVAMAALAGGLAFGLGGQDAARELLSRLNLGARGRRLGRIDRQPVYASEVRPQRRRNQNHVPKKTTKKPKK